MLYEFMDAFIEEWGLPVRIYKINTPPNISNEEICEKELVFDAKVTGEVWYTKETTPDSSYLFLITDFKTDDKGNVSFEGYELDDSKRIVEVMYFSKSKNLLKVRINPLKRF